MQTFTALFCDFQYNITNFTQLRGIIIITKAEAYIGCIGFERMIFMYENNYNYIDVPDKDEKRKSGAGKTAAIILAAAIIGGASGFGGAYLQQMTSAENEGSSASDSQPVEVKDNAAVTTTPVQNKHEDSSMVSSLLSPSAETGSLSTKQIVQKVSPSVVGVHSSFETQMGESTGTGTGIIFSDSGYIITNAHVVQTEERQPVSGGNTNRSYPFGGFGGGSDYDDIFEYFFGGGNSSYQTVTRDADKVTIVLSNSDETEYEAEIIGADENSDLAVLKIDASKLDLTPAEFGDSNELTMGDKAVAIGYPLGLGLSTSEGIVSGLNRTLNVELSAGGSAPITLIQTDAAINPGNSGGPLINQYGQVVGITSSKLVNNSVEGLGFAIPITDAMPIISDLMNKGYVTNTTPQIGITGTDINTAIMRYYNLPVDKGVMVVSVAEKSGAEAAGICPGDVIVAADGKEITNMNELTSIKAGKKIGDTMTLTLARVDENIDIVITLTGEEDTE